VLAEAASNAGGFQIIASVRSRQPRRPEMFPEPLVLLLQTARLNAGSVPFAMTRSGSGSVEKSGAAGIFRREKRLKTNVKSREENEKRAMPTPLCRASSAADFLLRGQQRKAAWRRRQSEPGQRRPQQLGGRIDLKFTQPATFAFLPFQPATPNSTRAAGFADRYN
jgi:hypothetical protein